MLAGRFVADLVYVKPDESRLRLPTVLGIRILVVDPRHLDYATGVLALPNCRSGIVSSVWTLRARRVNQVVIGGLSPFARKCCETAKPIRALANVEETRLPSAAEAIYASGGRYSALAHGGVEREPRGP